MRPPRTCARRKLTNRGGFSGFGGTEVRRCRRALRLESEIEQAEPFVPAAQLEDQRLVSRLADVLHETTFEVELREQLVDFPPVQRHPAVLC